MNILIAGLKRLLANIIRIGIVSDVDLTNGLCRVRIGNLETDQLNWLTLRTGRVRFWSAPSVGEQVMVLSIGGELTTGFVLSAIFSDANSAPSQSADAVVIIFPDGARFEYEPETSHLTVTGIATAGIDASKSGGCYRPQYHLYCLGKNHTVAALKHYRVALMRINTSAAPEIDWPELPQ